MRAKGICPDKNLVAISRDDDTTFGILHSRFHEAWSLRLGTWLGVGNDPRYTPTTTFETFPFPEGLTPNIPAEDYADDPRATPSRRRRRSSTTCARPGSIRPISSTSSPKSTPTAAPGEAPRSRLSRPHLPKDARRRRHSARTHADQSLQPAPALARRRAPRRSTPRSPPPMAGPLIFPTTTHSPGFSRSTSNG